MPPALRFEKIAITNFRTFRERTEVPLWTASGITTFHGDNGSGKSTALAALSFALDGARWCLANGDRVLGWDSMDGPVELRRRDVRSIADGPMELELTFEASGDQRAVRVRVEQRVDNPNAATLSAAFRAGDSWVTASERAQKHVLLRDRVLALLTAPRGTGSRPLAILDAQRRAKWAGSGTSPLVEQLFERRISKVSEQRERWRAFQGVLDRSPTLHGKEISVDRVEKNADPVLFVEERGKTVLALDELSSGERQFVLLSASVFVSDASVVAIEEPELSLDAGNQALLREILAAQIAAGLVDQVIIESHVASFDGPDVVRFERDAEGVSRVHVATAAGEDVAALREHAKSAGADQQWVTREGFTKLPTAMVKELGVGSDGKLVWFLRGPERWEVWPEQELETMLGGEKVKDAG
jgi:hypothetical protein